jgi:ribonucleoside-triphosphate reductase
MDNYQQYIAKSRYARYLPEQGRRETWPETVARYVEFFREKMDDKTAAKVEAAILNLDVMPSMRAVMTAGPALERDNVAGFNCSYLPIDHPRAFDEMMYILMCGTGVGYSVERQYVNKLPEVAEEFHETDTILRIADSKAGWASGFRELISLLYSGRVPGWDTTGVRPAGSPLKTFGGRASGPEPLEDLFRFACELFRGAAGRRLNSLECHDLCCKIADIVVVGGVRRSALISLSNLTDDRMRRAKQGEWWQETPHRALANNSACYTEKPDFDSFLEEWTHLYQSKSGERGIFSRPAAQKIAARNGRRDPDYDFGTNPCSEIILRPNQFCNLSEVVLRSDDTPESFMRKVELATIMGTLQATLTDFRYLRKKWADNTKEEALLGVSITGVMDNTRISGDAKLLEEARELAIATNKAWAKKLGINQSAAITCVKPSGTVSQLVNSASGCHPRFSGYYLRRVRADKRDPMSNALIGSGVPYEEDRFNPSTWVFSFPIASPKGSTTTSDMGAMEQLRVWNTLQEHWCEHKPSITVYYTDAEFLEVGQWVYNNFDTVSGISFLPYSDHTYVQAPYEEITEEQYRELSKQMPTEIDWNINEYSDETTGAQELACVAGACEI